MNGSTRHRPRRRSTVLIFAAIAAGALSAPLTLGPAYAAGAASVTAALGSADAPPAAALHVGVRQAGVGDPIPVTVVGGASGDVWEIVLVSPETTLGTLTVGADGTGTALVSLPADSDPGSVEIVARSGGTELSAGLSSAGDAAEEAESADPSPATADPPPATAALPAIGLGAGAALVAASLVTVVVVARRRTAR